MIWLKLLGVIGWLKKAMGALLGLVRSYPLQAALIASLCLSGWLWHGRQVQHRGWEAEKAGRAADRAAYEKASADNLAAQIAQVKALEAQSQKIAKEADNAYRIELADARRATDAYAVANRVRPENGHGSSAPGRPGEGNNPGVPDGLPAAPDMVAIRESDLQACTQAFVYALSAHNNAMDKIDAGVAVPPEGWPSPAF